MSQLEKTFKCSSDDCDMIFASEINLKLHQRHHSIQMSPTSQSSSVSLKRTGLSADTTPTSSKFLKQYEELTLFHEVNLNPFDLEFRKASQIKGLSNQLGVPEANQNVNGSLDTPRILPPVDSDETISSTSRDESALLSSSSSVKDSSAATATPSSCSTYVSSSQHQNFRSNEAENEKKDGRKRLKLNVSSSASEVQGGSVISTPTPVITAGPSVSQSLGVSNSPVLNTPNILTANIPQITLNGIDLSDLNTPGLSPTLRLISASPSLDAASNQPPIFSLEMTKPTAPLHVSPATEEAVNESCPVANVTSDSKNQFPPSSATVLQLLLKLPDGQSIPVEIPATPIVSAVAPATTRPQSQPTVAFTSPAYQTTAFTSLITNPTPSLAKMKLKEALASSHTAARPGSVKYSRATTADRIAEMTRLKNMEQYNSVDEGGFIRDDNGHSNNGSGNSSGSSGTASSGNIGTKGVRRRRNSSAEEDPDTKRRKFLERNRVAAVRCREKKKRQVEMMVSKSETMGMMNQRLLNEVSALKAEVAALKCLLLKHKDCPVTIAMKTEDGGGTEEVSYSLEEPTTFAIRDPHPSSQVTLMPVAHTQQPIALLPIRNNPSSPALSHRLSPESLSLALARKRSLSLSSVPVVSTADSAVGGALERGSHGPTTLLITSEDNAKQSILYTIPASTTSSSFYNAVLPSSDSKIFIRPYESHLQPSQPAQSRPPVQLIQPVQPIMESHSKISHAVLSNNMKTSIGTKVILPSPSLTSNELLGCVRPSKSSSLVVLDRHGTPSHSYMQRPSSFNKNNHAHHQPGAKTELLQDFSPIQNKDLILRPVQQRSSIVCNYPTKVIITNTHQQSSSRIGNSDQYSSSFRTDEGDSNHQLPR